MDFSDLLSSSSPVPPKPKTYQDLPLDDIDLGLGGLHYYHLRSLAQLRKAAVYEDNNGSEEGDREEKEIGDNREDSSKDSDFDELGEDVDEEGDVVSLINSNEMSKRLIVI